MLHFILGGAKVDKTSYIHDMITRRAKDNLNTFLLVPEQATFQNEKKLSVLLPKNSYNTFVTGFTQLNDTVFKLYGGSGKRAGSDVEKLLIMASAAKKNQNDLLFYKSYYSDISFLEELIALYDELCNQGAEFDKLTSFSDEQMKYPSFTQKISDLSLLFSDYETTYSENYITEREAYNLAGERIRKNSSYFNTFNIYTDGFINFTHPQEVVLEALISCCNEVFISLPIGKDRKNEGFKASFEAMEKLKRYCKDEETAYDEINLEEIPLEEKYKTSVPEALEEASSKLYINGNEEKVSSLYTVLSKNPTEELEECASLIKKMVREDQENPQKKEGEKLRYKDFAIFTPDFKMYAPLIENVFKRYEIPYFADEMLTNDCSPLSNLIITAARTAAGLPGYDLTDLAYSPLLGLSSLESGEFANYCYTWSLPLSAQKREFKNNPSGIKEKFTKKEKEKLESINRTREKLAQPLMTLSESFKKNTLADAARGIYTYLMQCDIPNHLAELSCALNEAEKEIFLNEQNQIWENICDILDLFVKISDKIDTTASQTAELISMAVSALKTATIPRALDLVDIGSPKRMRVDEPKCVFILGTSMGQFPATVSQNVLLDNSDRRLLSQNEFMFMSLDSAEALEKAVCYRCLTSASEYTFVSLCRETSEREKLFPSPVYDMCRALSAAKTISPDTVSLVESPLSLKDQMAKTIRQNNETASALQEVAEEFLKKQELAAIKSAEKKIPHEIETETAEKLFGCDMELSSSQLDCFYNCRYKYFLRYGLHLKPLERAGLDSRQTGTFIHRLLEVIIPNYVGKPFDDTLLKKIKNDIDTETQNYINTSIADNETMLSSQKQGFHNISEWVYKLIIFLGNDMESGEFKPVSYEMPIQEGEKVEPLKLHCADGSKISVRGFVDRVDEAVLKEKTKDNETLKDSPGRDYIRIVDYKSGGKEFKLGDILKGLNMQMLIYLFSIWESEGKDGKIPAGILYQPAMSKYVNAERDDKETVRKEHLKNYKMNGLILDEPAVADAMGSNIKNGPVLSLDEMESLRDFIKFKITDMAEELHKGTVSDIPSRSGQNSHCAFCEYRSICSHRNKDAENLIPKVDTSAFLQMIEDIKKGEEDK